MKLRKNTKEALVWIVNILQKHKISFQITGGLAAKWYGSPRKVLDIDIEIADGDFPKIIPQVQQYLREGPKQYHDRYYQGLFAKMVYHRQPIELCGINSAKIFDQKKKRWIHEQTDLSQAQKKKIGGVIVPVAPRRQLIRYKQKMARKTDLEDVYFMRKNAQKSN